MTRSAEEPLPVAILCGGKGTRAYPETRELPKPLLTVGGVPIVEHVMQIYADQGHRRFVLAVGHLGELIEEHFREPRGGWEVEVIDTGVETETGERLRRVVPALGTQSFLATYGDGLGDVDLHALLARHRDHGGLATMTTVPLPSPYGTILTDATGRVLEFTEKPRLPDHWINAGFFVFEREAFDEGFGTDLEREVLPHLADRGDLFEYRHRGFWQSMDTFKDRQALDALVDAGPLPWLRASP